MKTELERTECKKEEGQEVATRKKDWLQPNFHSDLFARRGKLKRQEFADLHNQEVL